jgi:hypothetical protein
MRGELRTCLDVYFACDFMTEIILCHLSRTVLRLDFKSLTSPSPFFKHDSGYTVYNNQFYTLCVCV